MQTLWISAVLLSLVITVFGDLDVLANEDGDKSAQDIQRYCQRYSQCRNAARQQFQKCAGGFSQMFMAQSDSLRIPESTRSGRCERLLIKSVESEIQPLFELVEHDTFECTKTADPRAFTLDQTQTLICVAVEKEGGLDDFAISGAQNAGECRNTYESQMQRCDLLKSCCRAFDHCKTKAELDNNIYSKEEKLAEQLDECIGYKKGTHKAGISGSYKHIIPANARRAPVTTTAAPTTGAPTTAASPATLPTLPPPQKVLNDLVHLLFPNLASSTSAPATTTTVKAKAPTTTAKPTTKSIFQRVEEIRNSEKNRLKVLGDANASRSQIATWKAMAKKLAQIQNGSSVTEHSQPSEATQAPVKTSKVNAPARNPTKEAEVAKVPKTTTKPFPTPPETSSPTPTPKARIHAAPLISKDTVALARSQQQSLSKVYCENYIECERVVESQFQLCDERHQPEESLFGIQKQYLRSQFLANSKVTDQKVKNRCMEAVDPESQRQLNMLRSIVLEQNEKCTREAELPQITSQAFQECQNIHLITLISELFTQKIIFQGKSVDNAEKCYARVRQLQTHCSTIRRCCPQNAECVAKNQSGESLKYNEIVDQLKEEQTLCEKRRMRILNGLV